MPTFNQDQASTAVGYGGFLAPAAAGVGAGVIGTAAYATVSQAASDATQAFISATVKRAGSAR